MLNDVECEIGSVARHGATYGAVHVKAVKRIISYLYHTRHYGITYRHKKGLSKHDPLCVKESAGSRYVPGRSPSDYEFGWRSKDEGRPSKGIL